MNINLNLENVKPMNFDGKTEMIVDFKAIMTLEEFAILAQQLKFCGVMVTL